MAKNDIISLLAVIVSVCLTTCCSFNLQSKIALHSSKKCHGYSSRVSNICMMLPGQYRFVLKAPLNKRSTIPLDAGNSRTDLIQAEGSGSPCRIKVIGVGGGGGNAVNRMIESSTGVAGVELWVVNTDAQALSRSLAPRRLNIGNLTSRYCPLATIFLCMTGHCNRFISR